MTVVTAVLLAVGVAVVTVASVGTVLSRDPFARLHFSGVAASAGTVLVGAAVLLDRPDAGTAAEIAVVLLTVLVGAPLVSHALARSFRVRQRGRWGLDTAPSGDGRS